MFMVSELKAGNRVVYPPQAPIYEEQVHRTDLRHIHGPIAPTVRVVEFGLVVAVTPVVDRYPISVELGPCGSISIGLPGSLVGRLQAKPPDQHYAKTCKA